MYKNSKKEQIANAISGSNSLIIISNKTSSCFLFFLYLTFYSHFNIIFLCFFYAYVYTYTHLRLIIINKKVNNEIKIQTSRKAKNTCQYFLKKQVAEESNMLSQHTKHFVD